MKKVFIVIDALTFDLHQHPVFTGEIAYDLGQQEQINVHSELGVREFTTEGEIMSAITDYMREHVGEGNERKPISSFIILPVVSCAIPTIGAPRSKSVKGLQPEKKSSTK